MLATFLTVFPPLVLLIAMFGVGLSIDRASLTRVVGQPWHLAILFVLQVALLPAIGIVAVLVARPEAAVTFAILLIAACPAGGISNIYVHFARANVTLSVMMTVTSLAFSFATLPLTLAVLQAAGFPTTVGTLSPATLTLQLVVMTAGPVAIGMAVRAYRPGFALRWTERLRTASIVLVVAILAIIIWGQWPDVLTALPQASTAVVVFLGLALGLGYLAGRLLYPSSAERFAVTTEFGVRNLAIATYVAVALDGNLEFAGYAAIYLVLEAVVIFALGGVRRRNLSAGG